VNNADQQLLELLERWQRGDYRRQDEEAMRRLMTDQPDDFRREAAEGFMEQPEADHAKHMAALKARFAERTTTPDVPLRKTYWREWGAIAAIMTGVVLTIGWIAYNHKDKPGQVAHIPGMQGVGVLPIPSPGRGQQAPIFIPIPSPTTPAPMANEEPAPPRTDTFADETSSGAIASNEATKTDKVMAKPASPTMQQEQDMASPAEKTEDISLSNDGVAIRPEVNSAPARKTLPNNSNTAPAPSDTKSKTKDEAVKPSPKPSKPRPEPAIGWTAWDAKVKKEAILPATAKADGIRGQVTLLVDLNADGAVKRVGYVNSLGGGCDEIAERIVRSVRWTIPEGARPQIMLQIPFRVDDGN
jgi:hypothetical protein